MARSFITNQISHVTRSKETLAMVEEEKKGETEISADVYGLEILAYLPAKSVQSLETVCKDWLQLIRRSHFVRLHLSRRNARRIRVLVTVLYYPVILEYNNYYQETKRRIAFPPQFSGANKTLGSADGLIIILGRVSGEYAPGVFNPSTGKCSVLQLWPMPSCFPCFTCSWFGKLADGEYVLVVALLFDEKHIGIWVYKFTRSSNILNISCSTKLVGLTYYQALHDYGTLVQGVLYWPIEICWPMESAPRYKILTYHLSKNKHRVISPPAQCNFRLGSLVDGCSLIATFKRTGVSVVEVCIMKEDCWTKYANIGGSNNFSITSPLGFFPNGDLIMNVDKSRLMRYSFNHEEATLLMEYGYEGDTVIMCVDTLVSPSC